MNFFDLSFSIFFKADPTKKNCSSYILHKRKRERNYKNLTWFFDFFFNQLISYYKCFCKRGGTNRKEQQWDFEWIYNNVKPFVIKLAFSNTRYFSGLKKEKKIGKSWNVIFDSVCILLSNPCNAKCRQLSNSLSELVLL